MRRGVAPVIRRATVVNPTNFRCGPEEEYAVRDMRGWGLEAEVVDTAIMLESTGRSSLNSTACSRSPFTLVSLRGLLRERLVNTEDDDKSRVRLGCPSKPHEFVVSTGSGDVLD